jgi:uncharacterized protein YmfQ (DUF2313 family)
MQARATAQDYVQLLYALRPPGPAWIDDPLLESLAPSLSGAHNRALDMLEESDPKTAREMLGDWEYQVGLPDACSPVAATTLQERRAAVVERLTSTGGASIAYLRAVATRLGYTDVDFIEHRPFIVGRSRCGARLEGAAIVRHRLTVTVNEPRVTRFRTGASQCGDHFASIRRAEDLECRLRKLAGSHIAIHFLYQGA